MDLSGLNGKTFATETGDIFVHKLLGKGKSAYSYLAEYNDHNVVLKLMHNEICDYYSFKGRNKVQLEVLAYEKLQEIGIRMPRLISYNESQNYLLKEYIEGPVASQIVAGGKPADFIMKHLFEMYHLAKSEHINIDYFPTNFVISDDQLFYVDYEINPYLPEWDLVNWGLYYWANSRGFARFLETGNAIHINEFPSEGIPYKRNFEVQLEDWIKQFTKMR
jgi:TP53 regulating kinase and related kinases